MIKGIVHKKWKFAENVLKPSVSLWEQNWRNVASVSQQCMLCSEWVPSEWESDKNITMIHTTPVHQLMSWEDKSCVFVTLLLAEF